MGVDGDDLRMRGQDAEHFLHAGDAILRQQRKERREEIVILGEIQGPSAAVRKASGADQAGARYVGGAAQPWRHMFAVVRRGRGAIGALQAVAGEDLAIETMRVEPRHVVGGVIGAGFGTEPDHPFANAGSISGQSLVTRNTISASATFAAPA